MSEIDQYDHHCLGVVACPSTYERLPGWNRQFALYRFDSDATDPSAIVLWWYVAHAACDGCALRRTCTDVLEPPHSINQPRFADTHGGELARLAAGWDPPMAAHVTRTTRLRGERPVPHCGNGRP